MKIIWMAGIAAVVAAPLATATATPVVAERGAAVIASADATSATGSRHASTAGMLADGIIQDLILVALSDQHIDARDAQVELTASSRLAVAPDARIGVERISYQPMGRRFSAVLQITSANAPLQRMTVVGRLRQDVQVPVLNRRLAVGEVITASDLQWLSVGDRNLPANVVDDPGELIGRTPRRNLAPGTPLSAADLKRPAVVGKGSLVTMVLIMPGMQLTARGRALEEGAVGQTIRIANAQSNAVLAGVVLADGKVAVGDLPLSPASQRKG